ncbi:GntR family transcriptional regulator [Bosea caraganae]|uniref:GntR family transcriptional regulator n=1 Tax=Bosea caraganae TaxID=2763117 RepID=A0A370LDU9_9HYPH|nr:GntR family transcriptional regulator [Bosea caraganae]RDJ27722.1 GntR family transcriptional regulator [Bosea caraganae]RDJ29735.1 GntR family transcriptional regulator [Bosea caraganae]
MTEALILRHPRGPVARPARSTMTFEALKHDIMLGVLVPRSSLLELELAVRFGCSQGTIREALLQLQEEGLVHRHGHRGTIVSDCTADEAVEMFRVRQQIECSGVARALRQPSRTLIGDLMDLAGAMTEAAAAGNEMKLAAFDRDFHRRLFRDADLPALDPILHRCLVHNHRFKISQTEGRRDLATTAQRHLPIIAAIERGDVDAATATLQHHIATIVDLGPNIFGAAGR